MQGEPRKTPADFADEDMVVEPGHGGEEPDLSEEDRRVLDAMWQKRWAAAANQPRG